MKKYGVIIWLLVLLARSIAGIAVDSVAHKEPLWSRAFSDPYFMGTSMTSTPVVSGDTVYVVNRDELYALDSANGKIRWQLTLPVRMNSVCDPALAGNDMYIPLSGGVITCVDTKTRAIRWSSASYDTGKDSFQTLGRMICADGYLYAGTWCRKERSNVDTEAASDGTFFCIRCTDGQTMWRYRDEKHPSGYYWSRAALCRNRLYFTSEDGTLVVHDPIRDVVYETASLTDGALLRNGLRADPETGSLFTVSKSGTLIAVRLDSSGSIRKIDRSPLVPDAKKPNTVFCTSLPTLYDGRLYIGCAADGFGWLCVTDAATLTPVYRAKGVKNGEIKSGPLIYEAGSALAVFFTANESNGALYGMYVTPDATSGTVHTLFTPDKAKQFCLADVVKGPDGTLYYSNDSGTLFSLR